jgi:pimeloyl-ACP methyl ester carboxylesterase
MNRVSSRDFRVATERGELFARRWDAAAGPLRQRSPIILFHDSLGCVELWREFPETLALATGRSVLAYDRLGFGRSDPHPGRLEQDFIRDEAATAVQALRRQLGIGRFIAFGHSVGGGMAAVAAGRYAGDCEALVTEAAQVFVEDRTVQGIVAARDNFAQPGQMERLRRYHGDKADWVLGAWVGTWLSPRFADWSLVPDLRQVRCPVLAIHGENDEFGSIRHPQAIAGNVAGPAALRILAGCGHVPHREMGGVVLDEVAGWLAGLPPLHAAV